MYSHEDLGTIAEDTVAFELQQRGWSILERNYRWIGCELDIVAQKGKTLAIIEVKYRRGLAYCELSTLISKRKSDALKKGAIVYLARSTKIADWETVRIDVALVTGPPSQYQIRYYPAAVE